VCPVFKVTRPTTRRARLRSRSANIFTAFVNEYEQDRLWTIYIYLFLRVFLTVLPGAIMRAARVAPV
jgi:hypothetical protein